MPLISTLNSQFAWAPKPTMQACDDGWLPCGLAKLSKWNTPYIILGILYVIAVVCIITGLSVSILSNMCVVANSITTMMINASAVKCPWLPRRNGSTLSLKVSKGVLILASAVGTVSAGF